MRPLTIANAPMAVLALHDEVRRTDESRHAHRLHAVLRLAQGYDLPAGNCRDWR
jgi:hypothetical protein